MSSYCVPSATLEARDLRLRRQWSAVHTRQGPLAPALATRVDLLRGAVRSA